MNYLFIACDQLRFDTLSIHGNPVCQTPALDQIATEGVDFTNAHTTAPLCTPARGSIFTGNYALKHGMGTNCDMYHALATELGDPSRLLHHRLQENGYACGYIGKWHVGTNLGPCDYGFEGMNVSGYGNCKAEGEFQEYLQTHNLTYTLKNPIYLNRGQKTLACAMWDGEEESTTDWYLTNRTMDLIKEFQERGEDFFVTCQYWGPHGPHTPPKSYFGRADRGKIEQWKSYEENLDGKPEFVRRHLEFYRSSPKTWDECQQVIGMYYDYMMFIDSQIGRLLEFLKGCGLYENTVIIFTSDHGDMQFSHNGLIDKGFLYEEAMHIPLIVRHPSFLGKGSNDSLVSNMDILPTILADQGISCSCDGQSLLPVLAGKPGREDFLMEFHGIHFLYTQRAVITKDGYKFIWSPADKDELYDLNKDPDEIVNLCERIDYQKIKMEMIERLKKNAVEYRDPVMDYIYKIFGSWESPSGQVDATSTTYNR